MGPTTAVLSLCIGFCLAFVLFWLSRRRHRPWKIEYDATGYLLEQTERKLHPTRAKCKRILYRAVVCGPSVIAAFVLFFLPLASHLLYLRSQYLKEYRVPIPWTATVFSFPGAVDESDWIYAMVSGSPFGRVGGTTFWSNNPRFSAMTFGSRTGTSDAVQTSDMMPKGAAHVFRKEFKGRGITILCWQYYTNWSRDPFIVLGAIWEVNCTTSMIADRPKFIGRFGGREEAIPAFYKIIQGVTPIE